MTMDEDRIDGLLEAWGRAQRLDDAAAHAMLRSITGQPRLAATPAVEQTLSPTWWADLSAQVTAAVVLATTSPHTAYRAPGSAPLAPAA